MDTIFTLLIIILPIVLKLIGKKLEQAGRQPGEPADVRQEPIEDWTEVLRRHLETQQQTFQQPENEPVQVVQPAPVKPSVVPVKKQTKPVAKAPKPILKEETKKEGEKIDKKKLILYSEIMKPKYTE